MKDTPYFDHEKCNGCGLCLSVCLRNGLVLIEHSVHFVETVECDWCQQCEVVCPTGALTFPFEVIIEKQ